MYSKLHTVTLSDFQKLDQSVDTSLSFPGWEVEDSSDEAKAQPEAIVSNGKISFMQIWS